MHTDIFKVLAGSAAVDDRSFFGSGSDNFAPVQIVPGSETAHLTLYGNTDTTLDVSTVPDVRDRDSFYGFKDAVLTIALDKPIPGTPTTR